MSKATSRSIHSTRRDIPGRAVLRTARFGACARHEPILGLTQSNAILPWRSLVETVQRLFARRPRTFLSGMHNSADQGALSPAGAMWERAGQSRSHLHRVQRATRRVGLPPAASPVLRRQRRMASNRPSLLARGRCRCIELKLAPAPVRLPRYSNGGAGTFDFAFIDADKSSYDATTNRGLTLLPRGSDRSTTSVGSAWATRIPRTPTPTAASALTQDPR